MALGTDARLRRLSLVTYTFAGSMILFTATDLIAVIWPLSPGEITWRYGTVGLTAGTLYTALIAVLLAWGVAFVGAQRTAIRFWSLVSALAALVLLTMIGSFVLDFGDLRAIATQGQDLSSFYRASLHAALKLSVAAVAFSLAAGVGWIESKSLRAQSGSTSAGPGVIRASDLR